MKLYNRVKNYVGEQRLKGKESQEQDHHKTALYWLIIFFVLMLLFTLLSRAASGMTIAQVTVGKIAQGRIRHEIKAEGPVEAFDRTSILLPQGLSIEKLFAKAGQSLKKDEPIMRFERTSSELLLKKAQNELADLQAKQKAALTENNALEKAERALLLLQEDFERTTSENEDTYQKAKKEFEQAEENYMRLYIQNEQYVDKNWEQWRRIPGFDQNSLEDLRIQKDDSEDERAWKQAAKAAQDTLRSAADLCEQKREGIDAALKADEKDKVDYQRKLAEAQLALQEEKDKATQEELNQAVLRESLSVQIGEKQKEVQNLFALFKNDFILKSPVDGILISVKGEEGQNTSGGEAVAISQTGGGFQMRTEIGKDEVKWIAEGDKVAVTLISGGKQERIEGTVKSISNGSEKDRYELTISLPDGNYLAGENASLEFSKDSEPYSMSIPITALHTDNLGKDYILVVREQESILGKNRKAERVDVQIEDRDKNTMAVQGAIAFDDQIIISSSRLVEAGDAVRLSE